MPPLSEHIYAAIVPTPFGDFLWIYSVPYNLFFKINNISDGFSALAITS